MGVTGRAVGGWSAGVAAATARSRGSCGHWPLATGQLVDAGCRDGPWLASAVRSHAGSWRMSRPGVGHGSLVRAPPHRTSSTHGIECQPAAPNLLDPWHRVSARRIELRRPIEPSASPPRGPRDMTATCPGCSARVRTCCSARVRTCCSARVRTCCSARVCASGPARGAALRSLSTACKLPVESIAGGQRAAPSRQRYEHTFDACRGAPLRCQGARPSRPCHHDDEGFDRWRSLSCPSTPRPGS